MSKLGIELGANDKILNNKKKAFQEKCKKASDQYVYHDSHDPQQTLRDNENNQPGSDGQDWQFRIRIAPDAENLQKAAIALSEVLEPFNLKYKVYLFQGEYRKTAHDSAFLTKEGPHFDRNQVGKEVCVYMDYSSKLKQFQYQPEEYKNIILMCIKALQKANVDFGGIVPPQGDMNIPCEIGIPPVISYTAFRPYSKRHQLLVENAHNPLNFQDPLEGVKISFDDLTDAGIDVDNILHDHERHILTHQSHLKDALKSLKSELETIIASVGKDEPEVEQLLRKISLLESDPNNDELKNWIIEHSPRNPDIRHHLFCGEKRALQNDSELSGRLTKLSQDIESEYKKTVDDFKKYHGDFTLKTKNQLISFSDDQIQTLVRQNLSQMQAIFVRLFFIRQELDFLRGHTKNLINERNGLYQTIRNLIIIENGSVLGLQLADLLNNIDVIPTTTENILISIRVMSVIIENVYNSSSNEMNNYDNLLLGTSESDEDSINKLLNSSISSSSRSIKQRQKAMTDVARTLEGKGQTWAKVLGIFMVISGIILGAGCIALMAATLGGSTIPSALGVSFSMSTIYIGIGLFGGLGVTGGAISFASRDEGLAKSLQNVASRIS